MNMDAASVFLNLAWLVPLSVFAWFLVLPGDGPAYRCLVWWPAAAVVIVTLGAYIGAAVAIAFDETLRLAPISWVERPLFAAQAIVACAVIGGGWSYGAACFVAKLLRRFGWTTPPRQLMGTHS